MIVTFFYFSKLCLIMYIQEGLILIVMDIGFS